mgnify:CR=1 FL=1
MPLTGLLVGLLFGFLLQRGQFCFVSGLRELFQLRNPRFIVAVLVAVAIQSVGFFALQALGAIQLPTEPMPVLATLIGGLMFGIGIMLSRACASGSWFRSGEGAGGSMLVLLVFAVTLVACRVGPLKGVLEPLMNQTSSLTTLYESAGISPWWGVALLVMLAVLMVRREREATTAFRDAPSLAVAAMRPGKRYPLYIPVLIGLLGIAAWWLSAQAGREFGFGIAVPTAHVMAWLATGDGIYLNWGSLFVLGILPGAWISAMMTGEFQWRLPAPQQIPQRLIGGVLMGVGATLAGGCTIGNILVSTAYLSWQGWVATLMILAGVWIGLRITGQGRAA